jgi:hypothetical protein
MLDHRFYEGSEPLIQGEGAVARGEWKPEGVDEV